MKRLLVLTVAFTVIITSCGGGDAETAPSNPVTTPAPGTGKTDSGASAASATPAPASTLAPGVGDNDPEGDPAAPGPGASSDFCEFIAGIDESSDDFGTDPDSFRAEMEETLAAMERARDLAPPAVRDDVTFVFNIFAGFVDLLEEYDYNLFAIGAVADTDPRILSVDEAEYDDAVARIGASCGLDLDNDPGPLPGDADPNDPGPLPGAGGTQPPGGVPPELVPPDLEQTFDVGNGSVVYSSTASFEDLVDFYTGVIGSPLFADPTQMVALWSGADMDGKVFTVGLGSNGETVEVVVTAIG
jgi:hypothetical protein